MLPNLQEAQGQVLQEPEKQIQFEMISRPCSPGKIVKQLASREGLLDVYCWYEGPQGLPKSGADFMKERVFEPLFKLKQDVKLCLYSLSAWDFKNTVKMMPTSTPLGEAINCINTVAIESIYSSSFFLYCAQAAKESGLNAYINEEISKKEWLINLSAKQKKSGTTVAALFDNQTSLLDCIKGLDVASAYSCMQYVEGYYLIQESVNKSLERGQKKIEIAFVLPNDESKYYADFSKDIEKMLQLDFGERLADVKITISFKFFKYGASLNARPYIDRRRSAAKVNDQAIGSYFGFLPSQFSSRNGAV